MQHPDELARLREARARNDAMLDVRIERTREEQAHHDAQVARRSRARVMAKQLMADPVWLELAREVCLSGVEEQGGTCYPTIPMTGEQLVFYKAGTQAVFRHIERLAAQEDEP